MLPRFVPRVLAGLLVCLAVLVTGCSGTGGPPPARDGGTATVWVSELPPEARETLERIDAGGPFPYEKDGSVFGNFEGLLPDRERGYYREYTVETPGSDDRGARRLVTGRGGEIYYTDDHYASFRAVRR